LNNNNKNIDGKILTVKDTMKDIDNNIIIDDINIFITKRIIILIKINQIKKYHFMKKKI